MGKQSREKGARSEREVVKLLNAAFKSAGSERLRAVRILTETREGSFDVEIVGEGGQQLPFALQVKNFKRNPSHTLLLAFREARDGGKDYTPVGVAYLPREDGKAGREWLACLPLEDLAKLIALADELGRRRDWGKEGEDNG